MYYSTYVPRNIWTKEAGTRSRRWLALCIVHILVVYVSVSETLLSSNPRSGPKVLSMGLQISRSSTSPMMTLVLSNVDELTNSKALN